MLKNFFYLSRQYILTILTATIFFFVSNTQSFSQNNIFFIKNIQVSKSIDLDFSRDIVINETFHEAFDQLINRVLLSKDLKLITNVKTNDIKKLVESFQITNESFVKKKYEATFNILFNKKKLSLFLEKKNVAFSNPITIPVVFFPILYFDEEIKIFNENNFYSQWFDSNLKSEIINFILPFENLDDIYEIEKIQNNIENLKMKEIATKYNTNNYVLAIMNLKKGTLKTFLKMNLNNTKVSKNMIHETFQINEKSEVNLVIDEIKTNILDSWKKINLVNFALPLSLHLHFHNRNLKDLSNLEKILIEIDIINNYAIEEFNINTTILKINYYGDPKKLYEKFSEFNYNLSDDHGYWVLKKND